MASILMLLALLVHFASLYVAIAPAATIHIGFALVLSASLWGGVLLLWLELDEAHAAAMRAMVLPVAAITVLLPLLFPGREIGEVAGRTLLAPHLLVGVLAYSVLFLALLHAVLMASAERHLRAHHSERKGLLGHFLERLPPLLSMERVLFRLVGFGFVLLTLVVLLLGYVGSRFVLEAILGRL